MVPLRSLSPNAFGDLMWTVSKWHGEETTDVTVNGSKTILNSITYPNKDV